MATDDSATTREFEVSSTGGPLSVLAAGPGLDMYLVWNGVLAKPMLRAISHLGQSRIVAVGSEQTTLPRAIKIIGEGRYCVETEAAKSVSTPVEFSLIGESVKLVASFDEFDLFLKLNPEAADNLRTAIVYMGAAQGLEVEEFDVHSEPKR